MSGEHERTEEETEPAREHPWRDEEEDGWEG